MLGPLAMLIVKCAIDIIGNFEAFEKGFVSSPSQEGAHRLPPGDNIPHHGFKECVAKASLLTQNSHRFDGSTRRKKPINTSYRHFIVCVELRKVPR